MCSIVTLFGSDVLCIGNALMDTFAFVSDKEIAQAGVEKGAEASVSGQFFDQQLLCLSVEKEQFTGGSAANTAKGLGRLGCTVSLLARTGDDEAGKYIRSIMKAHAVQLPKTIYSGTTSRVFCLITPEGQRSFLFSGGTSGAFLPSELDEHEFSQAKIVHHDGYILRNKPLLEASLAMCKKHGVQTSLDLGAFSLVRDNRSYLIQKILPSLDMLIGNSDEMRALFGSDQEIHTALLNRRGISIRLQGENGCTIYENGHLIYVPTTPKKAIDSTGAGDLFISGFLYGRIQGWSLEKSASLGHRLAGIVIEHMGAEIPAHYWPEILKEIG